MFKRYHTLKEIQFKNKKRFKGIKVKTKIPWVPPIECKVKRGELIDYAQNLSQYFVHNCCYFYGESFTIYNIHRLPHLSEYVKQFGCSLNKISCFPFENYVEVVKKAVKNATNSTAQIIKCLQLHEAKVNESVIHAKIINRKETGALLLRAD